MFNPIREPGTKEWICKVSVGMIAAALILALVWRIQCSISYYDEVFNIYISYMTAAMGQRHLVENGYIFSMGDLFNLPFVFLYYCITNSMDGIVLFIRFVYLGFNLVLAFAFYKMFGEYCGRKVMVLFGLILVSFFPGGMYTVSYDTAALFFSLLGGILLLGSEIRENKKTGAYRYLAGVCHACMAYSYPLMAGVIILLFIGITVYHIYSDKMKGKELVHYWLPYLFGGMTVLCIFVVYVMYVGWENVFFLRHGFVQDNLGGREIGKLSSIAQGPDRAGNVVPMAGSSDAGGVNSIINPDAEAAVAVEASGFQAWIESSPTIAVIKSLGTQIFQLLNYMWIQQKATLGFTLVMLAQWAVGLVKKGKWRLLLLPEIFIVGFWMHTEISCYAGTTMYAYYFCWAPFLLLYLEKQERKQGILIFMVLGLISIASFFAIGFTSIRTDKAHVGLYCGAMCTFLLMVMIVRKEYLMGISLAAAVVLLAAVCNTGMAYIDHYQGADIRDCTYRMQEGVFKGMLTWEQDVQYEHLAACLKGEEFRDGATLYITDYDYYAAGIEGDLLSTRGNASIKEGFSLPGAEQLLQEGMEAVEVYEQLYWPDVVIVGQEDKESYSCSRKTILAQYYQLVSDEYDYELYVKK